MMKFKLLLIGLLSNWMCQPAQASLPKNWSLSCQINAYNDCLQQAAAMDAIAQANCGCGFTGGISVQITHPNYPNGDGPWPSSFGNQFAFHHGSISQNNYTCSYGSFGSPQLRGASIRESLELTFRDSTKTWGYQEPYIFYKSYVSMKLRDGNCDSDDDEVCSNPLRIIGLPFLRITVKC